MMNLVTQQAHTTQPKNTTFIRLFISTLCLFVCLLCYTAFCRCEDQPQVDSHLSCCCCLPSFLHLILVSCVASDRLVFVLGVKPTFSVPDGEVQQTSGGSGGREDSGSDAGETEDGPPAVQYDTQTLKTTIRAT